MAKITAKKLEDLDMSFYKGVIEVKIENPLLKNTQQVDQLDQWITQSIDNFKNLKRIEISTFIEKNDYQIEQYTQKLVKKFTIDLKEDTTSFRFKFTGRLLQRKITFTFDESFIHNHLPKNSNLVIIQDAKRNSIKKFVPLDLGEKTSYKLINFKEVEKSHLVMYENISDAVRNDVLGIQIQEPSILRPRDLMNLRHKLQVWLREFQHLRYVYIQTSINPSDRILFELCQSRIKELEDQFTTPIYFEDMSAPFSLREMKLHIRNPKLLTSESTSESHRSFLAGMDILGPFTALSLLQSVTKSAFSGTGKVTSMSASIAKAPLSVPKDGPAPMAYLKADEILEIAKEGDLIEIKKSMHGNLWTIYVGNSNVIYFNLSIPTTVKLNEICREKDLCRINNLTDNAKDLKALSLSEIIQNTKDIVIRPSIGNTDSKYICFYCKYGKRLIPLNL